MQDAGDGGGDAGGAAHGLTFHFAEYGQGLLVGQYGWQVLRSFGTNEVGREYDILLKDNF